MATKKTTTAVTDENIETTETEEVKETKKTASAKKTAAPAPARRLFFRPVTASEIDARIQAHNSWRTTVLLYKDARVDQNILDETVGCYNWQKEYSRDNQNCTVSIWDEEKKQWISKEDTGTESNTEKETGLASDSFKRACFCWGIGRELYTTPLIQIPTEFIEWKTVNGKEVTYDRFIVTNLDVAVDEATGIKRIVKICLSILHNGKQDWVWAWQEGETVKQHKPAWITEAEGGGSSDGGVVKSGGWGKSNNSSNTSSGETQTGKGFKKPASNSNVSRPFGATFKKSS